MIHRLEVVRNSHDMVAIRQKFYELGYMANRARNIYTNNKEMIRLIVKQRFSLVAQGYKLESINFHYYPHFEEQILAKSRMKDNKGTVKVMGGVLYDYRENK